MYDNQEDAAEFPSVNLGPYQLDRGTGRFQPRKFKPQPFEADSNLPEMVKALLKGYVRKQQNPIGGNPYFPYTSAAPAGMTDQFRILNKYNTFGVPYTGTPYGQKTDTDDAMGGY